VPAAAQSQSKLSITIRLLYAHDQSGAGRIDPNLLPKGAGQYQEAQVLTDQSLEHICWVQPGLLKPMDDTSILRL
jgi:hypothetical protein